MSSTQARQALAEAVNSLVKTSQPTSNHYEAICKALQAAAAQDFGIPIRGTLEAYFSEEATA